jgi:hypothetical protein
VVRFAGGITGMSFFEIAVLVLLVAQTLLVFALVSMMGNLGRELDFKLNMIDGSLNQINDRQVKAQASICQSVESLGGYLRRPRDRTSEY